jgi:hypothetical protein
MTYKITKAVLQKVNSTACSDPLFKTLDEHQARMASDPAIRRRRAESWKAMIRGMAPEWVFGLVFNSVLWASSAGFVSPEFSFAGWVISCLIVAAAFRP